MATEAPAGALRPLWASTVRGEHRPGRGLELARRRPDRPDRNAPEDTVVLIAEARHFLQGVRLTQEPTVRTRACFDACHAPSSSRKRSTVSSEVSSTGSERPTPSWSYQTTSRSWASGAKRRTAGHSGNPARAVRHRGPCPGDRADQGAGRPQRGGPGVAARAPLADALACAAYPGHIHVGPGRQSCSQSGARSVCGALQHRLGGAQSGNLTGPRYAYASGVRGTRVLARLSTRVSPPIEQADVRFREGARVRVATHSSGDTGGIPLRSGPPPPARPVRAHAALSGVHRLSDSEPVGPQMAVEGQGGVRVGGGRSTGRRPRAPPRTRPGK